ncbi:flagellar motor protein MotA [Vineibacter terrae]|uniref:flagellar motor protein MotA n=1 Tax=Vineibacter terrae TaxID=2586908 RepID=UPI002E337215|nr:flagellar motor protein MotA [Vineibacter terrae]HEX2891224.1 flagellar motor protein MotA [Vineibacter terrae]
MTRPRRFLLRMLLFLAAVSVVAWILREPLVRTFWHNPVINGAILVTLFLGLLFIFRQVFLLGREVRWLEGVSRDEPPATGAGRLRLLAPMATMLGERRDKLRLSPMATRSLLDGIAARLDEQREISRYAIGLLIFLGLLGTFWGLLDTVSAVGDAISKLQLGGDGAQMFGRLKENLEGPLKGMGTAFGSSLFGLSGSLVLGFMELQAGQAQNRFFNDLEDWLAAQTRLSGGSFQVEGDQPLPAYVEALLEQSAESIDKLQRTLERSEEQRSATGESMAQLGDWLQHLAETIHQQQAMMSRLVESGIELRETVARFTERTNQTHATDDPTRAHLRNLEAYTARLLEETVRNRTALADELRGEFKLLARTLAARSAGGPGAPPSAPVTVTPALPPPSPPTARPAPPTTPVGPAGPRPGVGPLRGTRDRAGN